MNPRRKQPSGCTLRLLVAVAALAGVVSCGGSDVPAERTHRASPHISIGDGHTPVAHRVPARASAPTTLPANTDALKWMTDAGAAKRRAKREGRLLLTYVHADWSVAAQRMQRDSWGNERLPALLAGVVLLRIDLTGITTANQHAADRLGASVPMVIMENGVTTVRHHGFMDVLQLARFLREVRAQLEPSPGD